MNLKKIYQNNRNIIIYGVVGLSAVVVDVLFFALFFNVFLITPILATILSVCIAMVYGFTLNVVFNFKTNDYIKTRFLSYAFVSLIGLIASALIIKLAVSFDIDVNIAKIVSLPPIVILQYIFNKMFAFKATE